MPKSPIINLSKVCTILWLSKLMMGTRNSESTTWWCSYKKDINYSVNFTKLKEMAISSVFPSSRVSIPRISCWPLIAHNIRVNAWFMKISSWSLRCWDTAMVGMKVIFHLGNIIQLICLLHTYHLCLVYIYLQPVLSINWSVKFTLIKSNQCYWYPLITKHYIK